MRKLLLAPAFFFFFQLNAQDEGLRYENYVYLDYIRTVRFHLADLYLSQPIYEMNSSGVLLLSFDDLEGDVKNYTYSVVHCDRNWNPTPSLTEMEYIEGFPEQRINNYHFSFKTVQNYTHYRLTIPNRDMNITKSGNYLLKVYEDEREKKLAVTRRFMVVDSRVSISPRMVIPSQVSKSRTHQEIDFIVDHDRFDIRSPQQEVRAIVLQNGRWDNAITDVAPIFVRGKSLVFDYQDKIVFPAGKEFRYFDIRSLRNRRDNVAVIEEFHDGFEVALIKDDKRVNQPYLTMRDVNGNFVVETQDQNLSDLASNYADVLFSLYSTEPISGHDVYVLGAFTDYQLKDENRMVYNERVNAYVAKIPLKQGFYDYMYGVVPTGAPKAVPDWSEIEGNWFETENEYTILVYYKPFGGRYDQLIGMLSFSSTP